MLQCSINDCVDPSHLLLDMTLPFSVKTLFWCCDQDQSATPTIVTELSAPCSVTILLQASRSDLQNSYLLPVILAKQLNGGTRLFTSLLEHIQGHKNVTLRQMNYLAKRLTATPSPSLITAIEQLNKRVDSRAVESNFSAVRPTNGRAVCVQRIQGDETKWSQMQVIVQSTANMLMLGGSGGMLPGNF